MIEAPRSRAVASRPGARPGLTQAARAPARHPLAARDDVRLPAGSYPVDLRHVGGAHERLLPNLMIAGVTHAGATRLARALGRHEEIKRPTVKRIDRYDPMRFDRPIDGSLADYDRYFANWTGQQYRMERSPTYFDGGRSLVRSVACDLPDLRVLIVLRDPAERLWSGYRDKIATGRLPRAMTYQAYVERCLALRANGADRFEGNRHFRTLSCGLYAEHLGDWLELFGRRLQVVFAEDLDRSATAALDGVFRWLGLEPTAARQRAAGVDVRAVAGSAQSTGLQTFDSPAERSFWQVPPDLLRTSAQAGRDLARRIPRPASRHGSGRPRTRADRLYQRANCDLVDLLRSAGYRDLPDWLSR